MMPTRQRQRQRLHRKTAPVVATPLGALRQSALTLRLRNPLRQSPLEMRLLRRARRHLYPTLLRPS
jgi:hypothetical protein